MKYAQLVVGPPGSGKTTYCKQIRHTLAEKGREVVMVNLDPANEPGQEFDVDIRELISLEDVMERLSLGPNGGLVYCIEHLAENIDWLQERICDNPAEYFIIDCPGQVELYTHQHSMKKIVETMQGAWKLQMCCVNVVDSQHCYDPGKFIAVLVTCLSIMIQLELPHVNVLSKIDLLDEEQLPQRLEFFTDVVDLSSLIHSRGVKETHPIHEKFDALSEALAEMVEDFGLVHFMPLDIMDSNKVVRVIKAVDRGLGYLFWDTGEDDIGGPGAVGEDDGGGGDGLYDDGGYDGFTDGAGGGSGGGGMFEEPL